MVRKLLSKWSQPHRVRKQIRNAYVLEQSSKERVQQRYTAPHIHPQGRKQVGKRAEGMGRKELEGEGGAAGQNLDTRIHE
jgi:hypothetical protein